MKTLLSVILTLSTFYLSAQHKKNYYYNENLVPISEKAFWADQDLGKKLHLNYDVDTAIIYLKVLRNHAGTI